MNSTDKSLKIYIAGHRGLVGSALLRKLKEKGYDNLIYKTHKELDLTRQKDTEEFFEKERPDWVILAAARVGGIIANSTYKAEFIYDNLAIALNTIHSAYKYKVKKLLNLGSSCIYPKFAPQPMKEDYLLSGKLEPTNEPYAIAKISAIKLCRYYNEQYGVNFLSVMPTNVYGSGDNFNIETAHVFPALIRKFYLAKLLSQDDYNAVRKDIKTYKLGFGIDSKIDVNDVNSIRKALEQIGITKDYVRLWGSGEPYREFLHVDDLADACAFLMENVNAQTMKKFCPDYFVNIGIGKDIKLKELALMIKDIIGFKGEIVYDRSKPDGTPRKLLDISKIKDLGWEAKTSLEEGIKKTYEWYVSN